MFEQLKYGDFIKINNNIQMVKYVEKIDEELYKIIYKDMSNGTLKEEFFYDEIIKKLNIKLCNLKYKEKDDFYYYFEDDDFGEELKYTIPLIGSDFKYIVGSDIKTFEKRVQPIICNYEPSNIIKNSLIELKCDTENSLIYYTIDGSEPNENSLLYIEPIKISENVLIKAVALKEGFKNSVISNFDFRIRSKKIKIFLSPSRQKYNKGVEGSGFTTEYEEMNLICDEIEKILSNYDCILYRNNYETFIEDWSIVNKEEDIDCHLAIHSNATYGHWKKGVENWIHDEYSDTYSLAKKIYNNVYAIYYDNKNPVTNRGVKYSKGKIAEASPAYFKFGMNLEIAFHDNLEDAKWIVNNRENIAEVISDALIEYYQLNLK